MTLLESTAHAAMFRISFYNYSFILAVSKIEQNLKSSNDRVVIYNLE